jgi:ceramide glucosyltransferase
MEDAFCHTRHRLKSVLLLLILVAGSTAFSVLAILGCALYRSVKPPEVPNPAPPITVLKPLHGMDEGLRDNLRSFFEQDYPAFEILFVVEAEEDAAVPVVRRLIEDHPRIPARLVIAGPSPFPNAKVHSLRCILAESRYDLVVMSDSDVRVTPEFLRTVAAEMSLPNVALVTSPYRAVAGVSLWSRLEALGLNTEFIAGVLVARLLGGMDFALGPTIVTRKTHLAEIGGLAGLQPYLAEDFVMGHRLAQLGRRVVLSSYAIEHRIGSQSLAANLSHRLRWNRSTRRSRPIGYAGQIFTFPLPFALALLGWNPGMWPVAIGAIAIRFLAAWRTSGSIQANPSYLWLPVQDLLSFAMWAAGFFGNEITWRTRRFTIDRLGRFQSAKHGLERTNETQR